jgi:hypothetical protein
MTRRWTWVWTRPDLPLSLPPAPSVCRFPRSVLWSVLIHRYLVVVEGGVLGFGFEFVVALFEYLILLPELLDDAVEFLEFQWDFGKPKWHK